MNHVALAACGLAKEQRLAVLGVALFVFVRCRPAQRSQVRNDRPDLIRGRVGELRAWHVRSWNALHDGSEQLRIGAAARVLTGREIGAAQSFCIEPVAARAWGPEERSGR